jgi:hypothetical protein
MNANMIVTLSIVLVLAVATAAFYALTGVDTSGENSATTNTNIPEVSKWIMDAPDYGEEFNSEASNMVMYFDMSDANNPKAAFHEDVGHGFLSIIEWHGGKTYYYQTVDKAFLKKKAKTLHSGQDLTDALADIDAIQVTKDGCIVKDDTGEMADVESTSTIFGGHFNSPESEDDNGSKTYVSGETTLVVNSKGDIISINDQTVHSITELNENGHFEDVASHFEGCSETRRLDEDGGHPEWNQRKLNSNYDDNGLASLPGTNWCGPGDLATDNVPPAHCNDAACRRHDHCDNGGVQGHTSSTLLCGCDKRIYDSSSSSVDFASNAAIGIVFWEHTPWPCLGRDEVCKERSWSWRSFGKCVKHEWKWSHRYFNKYSGTIDEGYLADPKGISASSKGSDQTHCELQ